MSAQSVRDAAREAYVEEEDGPILTAALELVRRGFAIVPLDPEGSKNPYFEVLPERFDPVSQKRKRTWGPLKHEERYDEAKAIEIFGASPVPNLGVICGDCSDFLVVADLDYGHRGHPNGPVPPGWMSDLLLDLPTPVASTPSGGSHVWLRSKGHVKTEDTKRSGTVVEIKGQGVYVQVPPSSGYSWLVPLTDNQRMLHDHFLALLGGEKEEAPGLVGIPTSPYPAWPAQAELPEIVRLDGDPAFVADVAQLLGLPVDALSGRKFRCILPGHSERRASANLWRDARGIWVYRDHHLRSGGHSPSFALAEVYASLFSRRVHHVRGPSLRMWKLRLMHATGRYALADSEVPELPEDAPQDARIVYEGIVYLARLRAADGNPDPFPFAESFAVPWCGMGRNRFYEAMGWLLKRRCIHPVAQCGRMNLYSLVPRGVLFDLTYRRDA